MDRSLCAGVGWTAENRHLLVSRNGQPLFIPCLATRLQGQRCETRGNASAILYWGEVVDSRLRTKKPHDLLVLWRPRTAAARAGELGRVEGKQELKDPVPTKHSR